MNDDLIYGDGALAMGARPWCTDTGFTVMVGLDGGSWVIG